METYSLKLTNDERWLLYKAVIELIADIKTQLINAEIEYNEIDEKEQELYQLIELSNKIY